MSFIKPDFNNSNLNVSATLAEYLGVYNYKPTIAELKERLSCGFKNVVFLCVDGLRNYPLEYHLPKTAFLRKHVVKTLTSTFPSTTTNATTSLATNTYPLEHGWFGWNLYFKEINAVTELFTGLNAVSGEPTGYVPPIFDSSDYYFLRNKTTDIAVSTVMPPFSKNPDNVIAVNVDEVAFATEKILNRQGRQFVYAYVGEPDMTMHDYGVTSAEAKAKIRHIDEVLERLCLNAKDTLFVITADHGQTDVKGYVEFYKDDEMNAMLECTPYLDARTPAFRVKTECKLAFERLFEQRYGRDFQLYKSETLINEGYFGPVGEYGALLGDYIAVGTESGKVFLTCERMHRFKGHHTSLTSEEMLVPLILYSAK